MADKLLEQLLLIAPHERLNALAGMCDDESLRQIVVRLLRAEDTIHSPVDPDSATSQRMWAHFAAATEDWETPMTVGAVVGAYRILGEIDRGGTAVVYRAERMDGELTREVAVKLLKLGIDTEEMIQRFEQERQILADLDHPNIAGLLDAGRTQDGRPYFVMELVEGQAINRFCDQHKLSIEARLKLFLKVCDAVEYAHRNLIVHRDLKPANVLVAATSGRALTKPSPQRIAESEYRVKLLDFGIARLLEPGVGSEAAAPATRAFARIMTPEYASPEQIRGARVTTASDVYQLGLLLYELLAGRRPYSLQGLTAAEIEQTVGQQSPDRLSSAAPAALQRRLRGDLENIVGKALSAEPSRRYSSADRLAEDIRRHLEGLPVRARADTWFYRSRKFVRRHAVAATALMSMAAMATLFTGLYLGQLQRAYQQAETQRIQAQIERDRAESERVQAQVERDRAQAVTEFMNDLFGNASSIAARGNEVTVREMLDRGASALQERDDLSPALEGSMLLAMGRAYNSLGLSHLAVPLLHASRSLLAESADAEEQASILMSLAIAYSDYGDFEGVIAVADEATELLRSTSDPSTDQLTSLQLRRLDSQLTLMKAPLVETTAQLQAVVADLEARTDEPLPSLLLQAYSALSYAYALQDADHRSVEIAKRASEVAIRTYGAEDLRTFPYRFYHGSGMRRTDPEQAVRILQSLARDYERLMGRNLSLASTLNNLSFALTELDRTEETMAVLQRSIDIALESGGAQDRIFLGATRHLASQYHGIGQSDLAVEMLHGILPALDARANSGAGMDQLLYANALAALATIKADRGRPGEAERIYMQADRVLETADPDAWPRVRKNILEGMTSSRMAQGRNDAAHDARLRLEHLRQRQAGQSEGSVPER